MKILPEHRRIGDGKPEQIMGQPLKTQQFLAHRAVGNAIPPSRRNGSWLTRFHRPPELDESGPNKEKTNDHTRKNGICICRVPKISERRWRRIQYADIA